VTGVDFSDSKNTHRIRNLFFAYQTRHAHDFLDWLLDDHTLRPPKKSTVAAGGDHGLDAGRWSVVHTDLV